MCVCVWGGGGGDPRGRAPARADSTEDDRKGVMSRVPSTGKLSGVVSFWACSPARPTPHHRCIMSSAAFEEQMGRGNPRDTASATFGN